jgi:hypothetical protein
MTTRESRRVPPKESLPTQAELPQYEVPTVTTYRDEEILEKLGPAKTGSYGIN